MAKQIYVFYVVTEGKHTVHMVRSESEEQARRQLPEGCTVNKVEVK
jgi:hypothetical protein